MTPCGQYSAKTKISLLLRANEEHLMSHVACRMWVWVGGGWVCLSKAGGRVFKVGNLMEFVGVCCAKLWQCLALSSVIISLLWPARTGRQKRLTTEETGEEEWGNWRGRGNGNGNGEARTKSDCKMLFVT